MQDSEPSVAHSPREVSASRHKWVSYINFAASVASLLTLGVAFIIGSLVGRILEILDILQQPWSSLTGIGCALLAAAAIRAIVTQRGRRNIVVVNSADPPALHNFSSSVEQWDPILRDFGIAVLTFFCSQPDPTSEIPPQLLAKQLKVTVPAVEDMVNTEIVRLVNDIHRRGYAPGLARGDRGYFVPEDHISFKLANHAADKQRIGEAAAAMVESNSVIALDGGSTTLPIVESISERLGNDELKNLTIVTNSFPIARCVANLTEKHGWSDNQSPIRLFMPAGALRPNTLAISPMSDGNALPVDSLRKIFESTGPPSMSFVGANGMRADEGMTMPTGFELAIKDFMLRSTDRPYIVADASKFGVHNPIKIRGWSEEVCLLTCRPAVFNEQLNTILNIPDRSVQIRFC